MFMFMKKKMVLQELAQGFDQETAAVVIARLTSHKMEMEVFLLSILVHKGNCNWGGTQLENLKTCNHTGLRFIF